MAVKLIGSKNEVINLLNSDVIVCPNNNGKEDAICHEKGCNECILTWLGLEVIYTDENN